ncbi:hypothetical protein L208DRAFT_1519101, partial [Tricholoma matsutake]
TSSTSTTAYNAASTLPPLTDAEKDLLRLHQGCFKCHTFYAEHFSRNCTNPCPTAEDCKKVMAAYAGKAKLAYEKKKHGMTTIAAVFEGASVVEEDISDEGSDQYMDANEAEEYMPHTLSLPPHLIWTCSIDAPATCTPTLINTLIDHGSPPVLISSDLTDILCLTPRPLFKPLSVSGAFNKDQTFISAPLILTHYCRLYVQLMDTIWKSCTLNTVICLNLHSDLILGLNFLVKNKIVVDTHLQMAVAKESGYDRFNPPNPLKHLKKIKVNMDAFTTGPPDIIASIKTRIGQLAGEATLLKWDKKMKETFVDRFLNNIPHVKDLLKDVFHHINLLLGAPILVTRAYVCPQKYHAGWKTLIDQHVAVGQIQPSSSPYASPSFIILKADPTVLP